MVEIKADLGHGHWEQWIKKYFRWGIRTAQQWMELARRRGEVEAIIEADGNEAINYILGGLRLIPKTIFERHPADDIPTPAYAVRPILEYIPRRKIVWCPFDTAESEYVRLISQTNRVEFSHIALGQDFFRYQPKRWDLMVSNPPFRRKKQIFQRALNFRKPFALLNGRIWLNDPTPVQVFRRHELQLLMLEKEIRFARATQDALQFSVAYFCWNFLPQQIIMK